MFDTPVLVALIGFGVALAGMVSKQWSDSSAAKVASEALNKKLEADAVERREQRQFDLAALQAVAKKAEENTELTKANGVKTDEVHGLVNSHLTKLTTELSEAVDKIAKLQSLVDRLLTAATDRVTVPISIAPVVVAPVPMAPAPAAVATAAPTEAAASPKTESATIAIQTEAGVLSVKNPDSVDIKGGEANIKRS